MFYRVTPYLSIKSRWRPHFRRTGEKTLVLRTGSVFPPGHPTTRLSLELLTEALNPHPLPPGTGREEERRDFSGRSFIIRWLTHKSGKNVAPAPSPVHQQPGAAVPPQNLSAPRLRLLDVGCGSGVLALTAAACGVDLAVGVDLDRRAVRVSRENARTNSLSGLTGWVHGSTVSLKGPFEIIAANLPWPVQTQLAAELHRLAAPEAALILSGFRDTQEEDLLSAYRQRGWRLETRRTREEWLPELPPERSFTWVGWLLQR